MAAATIASRVTSVISGYMGMLTVCSKKLRLVRSGQMITFFPRYVKPGFARYRADLVDVGDLTANTYRQNVVMREFAPKGKYPYPRFAQGSHEVFLRAAREIVIEPDFGKIYLVHVIHGMGPDQSGAADR